MLIESESESEARLVAARTENKSELLRHEARLAADVETTVIVSLENESKSFREAILAESDCRESDCYP